MPKLVDITGLQFGTLTVVRYAGIRDHSAFWLVKCDCGCNRKSLATSNNLRSGRTRSCRGFNAVAGDKLTDYPSERVSWDSMMHRCYRPENDNYRYYGGRGIKVCARWHRFYFFLEDMGRKPTPKHTIERLDTDGDYEPNNCVWATMLEQRHNRRV